MTVTVVHACLVRRDGGARVMKANSASSAKLRHAAMAAHSSLAHATERSAMCRVCRVRGFHCSTWHAPLEDGAESPRFFSHWVLTLGLQEPRVLSCILFQAVSIRFDTILP